jgi:hypothetical protein
MDAFYDELEKLAGAKSVLGAALLSGMIAGSVIRGQQGPQARTDQVVRAAGGMTAPTLAARNHRRNLVLAGGTGAAALAGAAGVGPARAALVHRAGRFIDDVVAPSLARAEDVAARASHRLSKDIADEMVARSPEAGRSFGQGVREGVDLHSLIPQNGLLGRLLNRG